MNRSEHIWIKIFRKTCLPKYLIFSVLLFLAASCIKTDLSNCVRFSLQIKALDANGNDITTTGEAGNVQLYVFDSDFNYLDQLNVSSQDVVDGKLLDFTYQTGDNSVWVVAWSNLGVNQQVLPATFTTSTKMQDALVQLQRDADQNAINPDDLFGGLLQVCGQCSSNNPVVIERKTAMMTITAVGLPDNQLNENYYFVLKGANQDAYNFLMNLTGSPIIYRETAYYANKGKGTVTGSVVATADFTVYPLSIGDRFTIEVYNGDVLIGTANRDEQGRDIVPIKGRTVNVLLNFSGQAGSLEVKIQPTNWNEKHQWVIW